MQAKNRAAALMSFTFILLLSLASCQSARERGDESPKVETEVTDELSLKSDRAHLDELRKDVPPEVKRENDELAFTRSLMTDGNEEPSKVRERFNKALRDRRTKQDSDLRRKRDDFSKTEKRSREDFLRELRKERESFLARKRSSEERKRFDEDHSAKRMRFFNDEKDKRKDFESQLHEARKNFEDYARERTNQFNQEIRDYTQSYNERRKALSLKKSMDDKARRMEKVSAPAAARPGAAMPSQPSSQTEPDPLAEEFKQIPKTPGVPLGPSNQ